MKTAGRCFVAFLCSSLLLSFEGCLEIDTTTEVHHDGSLTRTVVVAGDSTSIYRGDYTITIDTSWSRSIRKVDDRKFELTATRMFPDAEALNTALRAKQGEALEIQTELETSFLWFFTMYRYTETYKRYNRIDAVPYSDFFSSRELELFMRHEVEKEPFDSRGDSLALDDASDRFEGWVKRNAFEAYYALFKKGLLAIPGTAFTPPQIDARKDTVFALAGKYFEDSKYYEPKKIAPVEKVLERIFGTRNARAGLEAMQPEFAQMKRHLEFQEEVGSNTYRVSVTMPGLVTSTNARSLEGNKATWQDFMPYCYMHDYELQIESRVINWWAIILTGAVIFVLAGVVFAGALRRRAPTAART